MRTTYLLDRCIDSLKENVQNCWGAVGGGRVLGKRGQVDCTSIWSILSKFHKMLSIFLFFSLLFYPCFMMSSVNSPEVLGNSLLPQIDDWPKGCFCYILGGLHIKLFPEHPHCHEEDTTNGT